MTSSLRPSNVDELQQALKDIADLKREQDLQFQRIAQLQEQVDRLKKEAFQDRLHSGIDRAVQAATK
jgi:hypothetical protein